MNHPAHPTSSFIDQVRTLLGPRGFTDDPELVEPWLTDWRGRFTGKTLGLASPASTDEVAALLRLCHEHRVPIVITGSTQRRS